MRQASKTEQLACSPVLVSERGLNAKARIPYGLEPIHVLQAMIEFVKFLGFINQQLGSQRMPRIESFLMPANFSSLVGEFMGMTIPKHCSTIVRNKFHNGHPDLLPAGVYSGDAVLHGPKGIEVKASRHRSGWQGHNPEDVWLMVFIFDGNSSRDELLGLPPRPFRFVEVLGANLLKSDWNFSGRSETSRRTITASVTRSGFEKMKANWIYRDL